MFNWPSFLQFNTYIFLMFTITVTVFYLIMFIFSFRGLYKESVLNRHIFHRSLSRIEYTKPVSILVPVYNEEAGIIQSVRSLISLDYPQVEIIIINDGSIDNTLKKVIEHFQMVSNKQLFSSNLETEKIKGVYSSSIISNLWLIDKENGGKADALNAGINLAHYSYFCSIDGDSILEKDAITKVIKPIIDSDGEVIATGGTVRIANGSSIVGGCVKEVLLPKNPLVIFQVVEYLRAFLIGRMALSRHNLMLIISGAFGMFSKEWVVKVGGYSVNTVGEDMELVVKLHKLIRKQRVNKRIKFVSEPVCWTEAPEEAVYLSRQRSRWHRGLIESLWKHKNMLFNPEYGSIGMVSVPYFWIVEFLGPVIELWGYIFLILCLVYGGIYYEFTILLFIGFVMYGSLITLFAVLLDEWHFRRYKKVSDVMKLYFYALTETVWFRPLTVIWRLQGIYQFFVKRTNWGDMKRKGL